MKELKPCPFCKGVSVLLQEESNHLHYLPKQVVCDNCGATIEGNNCVDLWNTRTDPPEDITGLAHELWALAQLMPEEGILDGVMRIEEALQGKIKGTKDPLLDEMAAALEELDDMFDPTSRVGEIINNALQKYRERLDGR